METPHHSIRPTGRSCHRPYSSMRPRPPPHPSHRNPRRRIPAAYCLLLLIALLLPSSTAKSSRRPITDNEIREKKDACYTDIENGLWGWACRSSATEKENCVLRCLSPECYDLIYGGDPLEEGELDYVRGQEYKYCMHKGRKRNKIILESNVSCQMGYLGKTESGKKARRLLARNYSIDK